MRLYYFGEIKDEQYKHINNAATNYSEAAFITSPGYVFDFENDIVYADGRGFYIWADTEFNNAQEIINCAISGNGSTLTLKNCHLYLSYGCSNVGIILEETGIFYADYYTPLIIFKDDFTAEDNIVDVYPPSYFPLIKIGPNYEGWEFAILAEGIIDIIDISEMPVGMSFEMAETSNEPIQLTKGIKIGNLKYDVWGAADHAPIQGWFNLVPANDKLFLDIDIDESELTSFDAIQNFANRYYLISGINISSKDAYQYFEESCLDTLNTKLANAIEQINSEYSCKARLYFEGDNLILEITLRNSSDLFD